MYRTRSGRLRVPRANARHAVDLGASFQSEDGTLSTGRVVNISIGGVFLETASRPTFGATVRLTVELPTLAYPLRINATVRWLDANGVGLQFGLMGARETHALTELFRITPTV